MQIYDVNSREFAEYGRVVTDMEFSLFLEELRKIPIPESVEYVPSVPTLEQTFSEGDSLGLFGGIPFQAGYCTGHNSLLNAVEYHRSSEFNVAATDAVLLLGKQQDISEDYQYHTENMEAFFIPAGVTVELYATTLHYAPCGALGKGFMVGVILPKGTNEPLKQQGAATGESRLLTAANKWLIGHPEGNLPKGTYIGLLGKNLNSSLNI